MRRRAARVDANHAEIVAAYRRLGCSAVSTASLGDGFPDIAVGYAGITALVEVKDGKKKPSARKLSKDEQTFKDTWKGGVRLVEKLEDVLEHVNLLRRWHAAICAAAGKSI